MYLSPINYQSAANYQQFKTAKLPKRQEHSVNFQGSFKNHGTRNLIGGLLIAVAALFAGIKGCTKVPDVENKKITTTDSITPTDSVSSEKAVKLLEEIIESSGKFDESSEKLLFALECYNRSINSNDADAKEELETVKEMEKRFGIEKRRDKYKEVLNMYLVCNNSDLKKQYKEELRKIEQEGPMYLEKR